MDYLKKLLGMKHGNSIWEGLKKAPCSFGVSKLNYDLIQIILNEKRDAASSDRMLRQVIQKNKEDNLKVKRMVHLCQTYKNPSIIIGGGMELITPDQRQLFKLCNEALQKDSSISEDIRYVKTHTEADLEPSSIEAFMRVVCNPDNYDFEYSRRVIRIFKKYAELSARFSGGDEEEELMVSEMNKWTREAMKHLSSAGPNAQEQAKTYIKLMASLVNQFDVRALNTVRTELREALEAEPKILDDGMLHHHILVDFKYENEVLEQYFEDQPLSFCYIYAQKAFDMFDEISEKLLAMMSTEAQNIIYMNVGEDTEEGPILKKANEKSFLKNVCLARGYKNAYVGIEQCQYYKNYDAFKNLLIDYIRTEEKINEQLAENDGEFNSIIWMMHLIRNDYFLIKTGLPPLSYFNQVSSSDLFSNVTSLPEHLVSQLLKDCAEEEPMNVEFAESFEQTALVDDMEALNEKPGYKMADSMAGTPDTGYTTGADTSGMNSSALTGARMGAEGSSFFDNSLL